MSMAIVGQKQSKTVKATAPNGAPDEHLRTPTSDSCPADAPQTRCIIMQRSSRDMPWHIVPGVLSHRVASCRIVWSRAARHGAARRSVFRLSSHDPLCGASVGACNPEERNPSLGEWGFMGERVPLLSSLPRRSALLLSREIWGGGFALFFEVDRGS